MGFLKMRLAGDLVIVFIEAVACYENTYGDHYAASFGPGSLLISFPGEKDTRSISDGVVEESESRFPVILGHGFSFAVPARPRKTSSHFLCVNFAGNMFMTQKEEWKEKRSAGMLLCRLTRQQPEIFLVHPGGPF